MKKIVLAFAIAVAAVAAQAASVTWSVLNIQAPAGGTVEAGWLVEVYDSSVTYSYDAAKAGTITALSSAAATASGTTFKATASGAGSYAANDAVNLYAVIYDASTVAGANNYVVSEVWSGKIGASGANLTVAFGNMAATTTANKFRNATWAESNPGGVPEPTSGLLLLVGGALLALRRKQK